MPTIRRFEEIRAWASARQLVNQVYASTNIRPFSTDFALRDQIRRAAISVMSNIVEGFDAGYKPEFIRFLRLALRSASEVQSQMYTALDQSYVSKNEFETIYESATQSKKQINAFISYLQSSSSAIRKRIGEERAEYETNFEIAEVEHNVPDDLYAS